MGVADTGEWTGWRVVKIRQLVVAGPMRGHMQVTQACIITRTAVYDGGTFEGCRNAVIIVALQAAEDRVRKLGALRLQKGNQAVINHTFTTL